MIRRLILGVTIGLLSAGSASAQVLTAGPAAANLQNIVGVDIGGNTVVSSVTAEDATLVITVDGKSGWAAGTTAESIRDEFLKGFCNADGVTFMKTGWVRVDTLDHGANLKYGLATNQCPAH